MDGHARAQNGGHGVARAREAMAVRLIQAERAAEPLVVVAGMRRSTPKLDGPTIEADEHAVGRADVDRYGYCVQDALIHIQKGLVARRRRRPSKRVHGHGAFLDFHPLRRGNRENSGRFRRAAPRAMSGGADRPTPIPFRRKRRPRCYGFRAPRDPSLRAKMRECRARAKHFVNVRAGVHNRSHARLERGRLCWRPRSVAAKKSCSQ